MLLKDQLRLENEKDYRIIGLLFKYSLVLVCLILMLFFLFYANLIKSTIIKMFISLHISRSNGKFIKISINKYGNQELIREGGITQRNI